MDWEEIITYVKDKRSNLNEMTIALKSIMKCEVLGLDEKKLRYLFSPFFSKTCKYATTNEKVGKNLKFISIKSI